MEIVPIHTGILKKGDDLVAALVKVEMPRDGDILVISSKAVATTEGAEVDLTNIEVTDESHKLADVCGGTPEYRQAILNELKRLRGKVVGKNRFAMLTEVAPEGAEGTILGASAGMDQSNIEEGKAVGWPHDPVSSAKKIRETIKGQTGANVAVIISDSCCRPRRLGVTAIALVCAGIDPFADERGKNDLYGKPLHVTREARADQLATAANMLMGNAGQATPAAIIRGHGFALSDFAGWVPAISAEEDLFSSMF